MKREEIVSQMEAMHNLTITEGRAFTSGEQVKWDDLIAKVKAFDQLQDVVAAPSAPTHATRPIGAPALHLGQRANRAGLLRGAIALASGERGIDTGLASEFDKEVRRRNPDRKFEGAVAMSLKSLLVTKADIGALGGGLAAATTGDQWLDSLFFRVDEAIFGPRLAEALGVNTVLGTEERVHITKLEGRITPSWIARDADLNQSDATFDSIEVEPKTVGCTVTLKRSALLYGTHPAVEPLMLGDLRNAMLSELDRAVLYGEGGNAPTGVVSVATASHSLATLADAYRIRNALLSYQKTDEGFKWLLPDLAEGSLATTAQFAGSTTATILAGTLAGYTYVLNPLPAGGSPTISQQQYLAGNWSYAHLILWDSVSILANPYGSQFASGGIELRVMVDANVLVRDAKRLFVGEATILTV